MKSRFDPKISRRGKQKKAARPPGGKALQRLFSYLGERDPKLNEEIVAAIPVPKAARPAFVMTKKALRAAPARAPKRVMRGKRPVPVAKSFAAAVTKAASKLSKQRRTRRPATRPARPSRRAAAAAPPTPSAAAWQSIGPSLIPNGQTYGTNRVDVIGRVAAIAVDPKRPKHLLLGAAGGGIWESEDAGATWAPRTDQLPSLAIGAIAFDPANPKKVYAGSGEGNFYAALGAGIYRSSDGGTTWSVAAGAPFIGMGFFDLVVDPKTPSILYAATTSGFYKSTNSGASWSLKRAARSWDITVHPQGGAVEILAAFADGLFVSTNAGNSFSPVALPSWPTGALTRLSVDRVTTSPDVAYAFAAAGNAAYLWRRAGTTWTRISGLPAIDVTQAWYDWYVAATPDNPRQIYLGAIDTFRGNLSGTTWSWSNITSQGSNSIHPDQHCLTFSPDSSKTIYAGNDGGIFRSANSGNTWTALNNGLGITEIEYMAGDPSTWKWLLAGTQDNGTLRYTGSTTWEHVADGDGGDCGVNALNPNIVYHSFYDVSLERSTNKGDTWTYLDPPTSPSLFYPPVEVFGLTVAIGATSLIVTRTGVPPWTSVPLGLTGGEAPSAMCALDANTLVIGTTNGRVLKVTWTGTAWKKTQLTSPAARYISCFAVDPSNPQRFWVTISQIGGGLVYRSDNAGSSWVNCTAGLPNIPMHAVTIDPADFKRVWVAADAGVYQTLDLGSGWAAFSNGLPNAMAVDLLFHKQDRMLICGTRNRGAWVIQVP